MSRTSTAALVLAWASVLFVLRLTVRLSPKRKWALAVAVPSAVALMVATFARMESLLSLAVRSPALVLLVLAVNYLLGAVVMVELVRGVFPRSEAWSDRRHFSIVGIVWLAFFAAGSALVLAGRTALQR
jgi:hypothetical protein